MSRCNNRGLRCNNCLSVLLDDHISGPCQKCHCTEFTTRQERFTRAVHIYAMHMAVTEGIDRSYPHFPGCMTPTGFSVQSRHHARTQEHLTKLRKLNDTKNNLIHRLELSEADNMSAFLEAGLIAQRVLDECQCQCCAYLESSS